MPKQKSAKITYCQTHLGPWAEHAAQIGTTSEQVALLAAATEAAWAARQAQSQAINAARTATLILNQALANMATLATAIITQVDARAKLDGNSVYAIAQIDPPAAAAPIAPPGTPERLTVSLGGLGELTLRWKCSNPRGSEGTMYHLSRSVDGGPMTFIAVVGKKRFIDETIPAGTARAVYQIRAIRSTAIGPEAEFPVNLGTTADRPKSFRPANPAAVLAA